MSEGTTFHLMIPTWDGDTLLAYRRGKRLQLPYLEPPKGDESTWTYSWNTETSSIVAAVAKTFSLNVYVRRCVWASHVGQGDAEDAILALELVCAESLKGSFLCRIPWKEAVTSEWAHIQGVVSSVELLEELCAELKEVSNRYPLWRRPGWFKKTCERSQNVIQQHGLVTIAEFEQLQNMATSATIRVKVRICPSDETRLFDNIRYNGYVYVRACLSRFHAPEIVATLKSIIPSVICPILDLDCTQNSIVHLGPVPAWDVDSSLMLRRLFEVQVNSMMTKKRKLWEKVPDRGLSWISASARSMLRHDALQPTTSSLLRIWGQLGLIRALCDRLLSYRIPHTLVHGNLSVDNFFEGVQEQDELIIGSWTEASSSYPLFDYLSITEIGADVIGDPNAKELYLECWTKFETRENINEAISAARPLMLVFRLFSLLSYIDDFEENDRKKAAREANELLRSCVSALSDFSEQSRISLDTIAPSPRCCLIIPRAGSASILAAKIGSGSLLSLPMISLPGIDTLSGTWEYLVRELQTSLKHQIGVDTFALRTVHTRKSTQNEKAIVLLTDYVYDDSGVKDNFLWLDESKITVAKWDNVLGDRTINALLCDYFKERGTYDLSVHYARPAWRYEGWFHEATTQVKGMLAAEGLEGAGSFRHIRNTSYANILAVDVFEMSTSDTKVALMYIKAVKEASVEVQLCSSLSSLLPGIVPSIVATDRDWNIFIQRDGGRSSRKVLEVKVLMETIVAFHMKSIAEKTRLLDIGIDHFREKEVNSEVEKVLSSESALSARLDTLEELRSTRAEILRYCDELFSLQIPSTLVHGDLHLDNIGSRSCTGSYYLLDWGSAFVGHPFCDYSVLCYMNDLTEEQRIDAENVYISVWQSYGSATQLRRMAKIALVVYWILGISSSLSRLGDDNIPSMCIRRKLADSVLLLKGSLEEVRRNS